jgi:TonB family protein
LSPQASKVLIPSWRTTMRRPLIYLIVSVLTFALGVTASIFLRGVLSPSAKRGSNSVVLFANAPPPQLISEQSGEALVPKSPIIGGVLNGKAISLPTPIYPAIARAAHASGTVTVWVTIDESGYVISSRVVGGHPLLQEAAAQAARQARFSPTRLSGQPVKVAGVITYHFVAE